MRIFLLCILEIGMNRLVHQAMNLIEALTLDSDIQIQADGLPITISTLCHAEKSPTHQFSF